MPTNVSSPEPLTVDKDGKPPVHRIQSASSMWGAFQDALQAAMIDDARFASIRGQYDGMPPVDPSELERQGLKDAPNFNTRQMTAKINTYVSTYVDLNTKGERMAEVQLKRKNFDSAQDWKLANQLVTECFNDSIKLWDSPDEQNLSQFIFTRVMCDTQMGIFGIGVLHFDDSIDWRPGFIPTRRVYPSRGTKITLDNCQSLFIEKEYTVARLYSFVKDPDAKGSKWNRKAMLSYLYNYSRQPRAGTTDMFESMAEWENRLRNNDLFLRLDFRLLPLVHCYIQEFDVSGHGDGITHYIIPRQGTPQNDFLFEYDREYKRWTQIIIPFCDSTGPEGDWHGVKGFGDQIFDGCHFANCFFNATALASIVGMFPMFKSSDESDREKLNQIVFSRMGVLYPDIDIEQVRINADISGALAIMGENNRVINQNSRMFPQNESRAGGEQPTATQVTFDRQDQAQFTSLQVQFYRSTGDDRVYGEMYKRLTASASDYPDKWPGGGTAKAFREKMEEYGITKKQYQEVDYVRASRTGGTGNMALDAQKSDQAFGVATPGQGQLNARKEKIAALYGWDRVPEFIEEVPMPVPEDALIGLENTTLQNGQFVDAYPFQSHERHLGEPSIEGKGHLAVLMAAQQAAVQIDTIGVENALQDAVKIDKVLQMSLQHSIIHVQFLEQLPANREVAKQLRQFLNQFVQFGKQFTKSIEKAVAKQQESQGQMSPEVQAKMAETQAKIAAIQAETAAEIQKMLITTKAKVEMQAATAQSRRELKEQDHAMKLGMDAETALIENQRKAQDLKFDAVQKLQDIGATAAKTRAQANAKKTNGNKPTE